MIVFNYTSLANQNFSNSEVSEFIFNAKNHGTSTHIKSWTVSCGCTTITYPAIIEADSSFSVKVKIDKRNQTGYTSQSIHITFDNGQSIPLYVSGKIS